MEYTKGEYKISEYDVIRVDFDSNNCAILCGENSEANAHLIAAAPDMYEALKDIVDPNDCNVDHHGHCQEHGWMGTGLCPHFRAKLALAKAKGKGE